MCRELVILSIKRFESHESDSWLLGNRIRCSSNQETRLAWPPQSPLFAAPFAAPHSTPHRVFELLIFWVTKGPRKPNQTPWHSHHWKTWGRLLIFYNIFEPQIFNPGEVKTQCVLHRFWVEKVNEASFHAFVSRGWARPVMKTPSGWCRSLPVYSEKLHTASWLPKEVGNTIGDIESVSSSYTSSTFRVHKTPEGVFMNGHGTHWAEKLGGGIAYGCFSLSGMHSPI